MRPSVVIYQYVRSDGTVLAYFAEGWHIVWPRGQAPVGDYFIACAVLK